MKVDSGQAAPSPDCDRRAVLRKACVWPALFAVFLLIAVGLHHPGFDSAMIYDSKAGIANNEHVFASGDLVRVMGLVPGRPLFMLSLYANYRIGGMSPAAFRLADCLILAAVGLSVVFLISTILSLPCAGVGASDKAILAVSALAGLVFVSHPLQVFSVLYIWQRQALMACLFYYPGLGAYIAARSGHGHWSTGLLTTSLLFLAGMLSKENVVSFPAALVLAEFILLRPDGRSPIRRLAGIAAVTLPPMAVYFLVNHLLQGAQTVHPRGVMALLAENYRLAEATPLEVLMTQCRVVLSYLQTIVAPFVGDLQLVRAETVSGSLVDPPTTLAAVMTVAGIVCGGLLLIRKRPVLAFGALFLMVAVVPESMLSPQYHFFGYRAILPMAGVLVMAAYALASMVRSGGSPARHAALSALAGAYVLGLGLQTFSMAGRWEPLTFWESTCAALPRSTQHVEKRAYFDVLVNYASELMDRQRFSEAIELLGRASTVDPDSTLAQTKLGLAMYWADNRDEAIDRLRKVSRSGRIDAADIADLGRVLVEGGNVREGLEFIETAARRSPADASIALKHADALVKTGDPDAAGRTLASAARLNPGSAVLRIRLGHVMRRQARLEEAARSYREALAIDPLSAPALIGLGAVHEQTGDLFAAIRTYGDAARLNPNSAEPRFAAGNVLMKMGQQREAITKYQEAIAINPGHASTLANLGTALLDQGQPAEAAEVLRKATILISGNPDLHNALGAALAQLGKSAEASDQFRRALEIDPNHAQAAANLEMLDGKGP